jgi:hypothetical protein
MKESKSKQAPGRRRAAPRRPWPGRPRERPGAARAAGEKLSMIGLIGLAVMG